MSEPKPGEFEAQDLARVAAGDPEAVDAWFRSEHPRVHRLCFGFLADATEAEDAAQDAMLHLLDHLHQFDRGRSYASWRTAVVLNLCRSRRRSASARQYAEDAAAVLRSEHAPDSAAAIQQAEVRGVLQESLARLSPREREAFVLRDLEDVRTEEVATCMGVQPATVRSLLTLARRRLRGLLERKLGAVDA